MSVLYFLIPLAAALVLLSVLAFAWAVRSGQFDDMATPPVRILFDSLGPTTSQRSRPSTTPSATETKP